LGHGAREEAARLLCLAVENCAKDAILRADAISELKTLGKTP
jgi:hypothetical protein